MTNEFLLHIFFIFDKCVFTLSVCKAYVILWVTNRFVGSETPKHNAFDQFWKLNSISSIFQETHDFVVLADPVIICIYLRTTERHFRDQGNVRHPTSKLLKCDLVQTLNTFQNTSLRIFSTGKVSLVSALINNAEVSDLLLGKLEKSLRTIEE